MRSSWGDLILITAIVLHDLRLGQNNTFCLFQYTFKADVVYSQCLLSTPCQSIRADWTMHI